jgi:hypothetical protein
VSAVGGHRRGLAASLEQDIPCSTSNSPRVEADRRQRHQWIGVALTGVVAVAALGGLAWMALADRPRVRVRQRDEPVADALAANALPDLTGHLLAAIGELRQLRGDTQLGLRASATRLEPGRCSELARLGDLLLQ